MEQRGSTLPEEAQPRFPWKGRIGIFWFLLGYIGACCGWLSISYTNFAKKTVVMDVYTIHGLLIVQFMILFSWHYLSFAYVMGRNALTYLIGRSVRFAVDVVTVCIAFMMRLFLEYDKFYIYSLVSFTVNIHAFWKLQYAPGDFGIWDVCVEVFMQIVVYLSGGSLPASAVVLISCGAITLYRGRNALTYLIGRSVRFAVDVVTVCIAFMMRQFLEYNKFYIYSLVSFTVNIHAFWKLQYAPGDFGIWDVCVEVFMQIVIYLSGGSLPASAVVVISCGAITLYRYFFYSAPLQPLATPAEKC